MNILGIIPARYASTRFPGKPLEIISGKSMIQRVYEQATKASSLFAVVVATDDERIESHVKDFCGRVIMTSPEHKSGTERCAELIEILGRDNPDKVVDIAVNVQGDEPFLHPEHIESLISCFDDPSVEIATLARVITSEDEIFNPNTVKVVIGANNKALYFSRSAIPFLRNTPKGEWLAEKIILKHIGIYAYRADVLRKIVTLKESGLENAESLEQLRWLENGYSIHVAITELESYSVDTPEDLKKFYPGPSK